MDRKLIFLDLGLQLFNFGKRNVNFFLMCFIKIAFHVLMQFIDFSLIFLMSIKDGRR